MIWGPSVLKGSGEPEILTSAAGTAGPPPFQKSLKMALSPTAAGYDGLPRCAVSQVCTSSFKIRNLTKRSGGPLFPKTDGGGRPHPPSQH